MSVEDPYKDGNRPWLVISNQSFPADPAAPVDAGEKRWLALDVSSEQHPDSIYLPDDEVASGTFHRTSFTHPWAVSTITPDRVIRYVADLSEHVTEQAAAETRRYIKPETEVYGDSEYQRGDVVWCSSVFEDESETAPWVVVSTPTHPFYPQHIGCRLRTSEPGHGHGLDITGQWIGSEHPEYTYLDPALVTIVDAERVGAQTARLQPRVVSATVEQTAAWLK